MNPSLLKWLMRLGIAVIVVLVVLSITRSKPFALMMLDRTVTSRFAHDVLGDRPDGLHVLVCGAGGPLVDTNRSGPCLAVQAGKRLFVVDAGTNGVRNMMRFGAVPGRIEAAMLTHAHSDHIDGLGELGIQRWVGGNHTTPLPVYGPPVISDIVAGFNLAYAADFGYRKAHHGERVAPSAGSGLLAMPFELPEDGETWLVLETDDQPPVKITAFKVSHDPVDQSVGYRFDYGALSLVVSGDTSKSDNLIAHAKGADLLVHEALSSDLTARMGAALKAAGNDSAAKIMADVPSYHATPLEAAESAAEAGVKHLVYYHIVPPLPFKAFENIFLDGVHEAFDGEVTLSVDGTIVSAGVLQEAL